MLLKICEFGICYNLAGFVCVRAFDAKTRAPRPISEILHRNTTAKLRKDKDMKK